MKTNAMLQVLGEDSLVRKRRLLDALLKVQNQEEFSTIYSALEDESPIIISAALKIIEARSAHFPIDCERLYAIFQEWRKQPHISHLIIRVLGNCHEIQLLPLLLEVLEDSSELVRVEAVEAILKFKDEAITPLLDAIVENDASWFRREMCAFSLSFLAGGREEVIEHGLEMRLVDRDERVQYGVTRAFRVVGNHSTYEVLKSRFELESFDDRLEVQKILKGTTNVDRLHHLLRRLTRLDEKRCHELLPLLQPDETSFERILEIKDILNSSDDPEIKGIVIRIMGYSGNESVVPVLTEYLQDPDSRIRAESVEALMDTGVEYVVELIQPMLNDFDNRVRANVAKGLWKLGGLTVLQSLKEMTQHSDKWMRASAAYALGEIGVIQVIDILRPVLNDPDVDVKINVVKALIKTGDKTAIEAVMEVAENRAADWIVRKTAVLALASLKTTEVLEFLQKLRNNDETNSHLTELVSIIFSEVKRQDSGLE